MSNSKVDVGISVGDGMSEMSVVDLGRRSTWRIDLRRKSISMSEFDIGEGRR
jgi:hypothetical protein